MIRREEIDKLNFMDGLHRVIDNPQLGYRLDLGEPGFLRSAKASESALRVTSQETRNLTRLKSQALREGHVILSADITYTGGISGSFPAVKAGHTRVVSREARNKPMETLEESLQREVQDSESEETSKGLEPRGSAPKEKLDSVEMQQLLLKEAQLRSEISQLEQRAEMIDSRSQDSANATRPVMENAESERLDARIQEKQDDLREIRIARLGSTVRELLDLIPASSQQAASIVQASYSSSVSAANVTMSSSLGGAVDVRW